jgi:hypothetical protein
MIFVIGWCVRRTSDADRRGRSESTRGRPTATGWLGADARFDDFVHPRAISSAYVSRFSNTACDVSRIVGLAGANTRRVARHARRGTVERDGLRRGSRPVPGDAEERSQVHKLQRPRVRPPLPITPLGARSRRGTLNRARDAQRRDADARLLSLFSAGTPSVSFATSSTRTRVWRVRTRRRRSPGPRRTRISSSDRPRCTSSSAASRGASSTPSAGNLEGRRSASHRRPERTLDPSTCARPYP